jgi:hypothetical protein
MSKRITFAAALGLTAALVASGCSHDDSSAGKGKDTGSTGKDSKGAKHTVVMEVTGTKTADVNYVARTMNSSGDLAVAVPDTSVGGATVPWTKTIEVVSPGDVTLTVNPPVDLETDATVSCRITVDGKEAAKDDNEASAALCTADLA